jgi:ElaB/YqjD/DUF883 family membrane-anchored ribosome-binding protein
MPHTEPNQGQTRMESDIQTLVDDAEELISSTSDHSGEKFAAVREKFTKRLDEVKGRLRDAQYAATDKYKQVTDATEDYVQDNPWKSVGIAAAVGLLVGLLSSTQKR